MIIVRREGVDVSHHDFRVRRSVVLSALQWLMENSVYYQHINLDTHALTLLPEDGNLCGMFSIVADPASTELVEEEQGDSHNTHDTHFTQSFVPINYQKVTEQEAVRQMVDE